jgi:MSHA biogenesis protein MshQ
MLVRILLFFFLPVFSAYANQCTDIFPGTQSFTTNSVDTIESGVTCNGSTCNPGAFIAANPYPTYSSSGNFDEATVVGGTTYTKNNWKVDEGDSIAFSGSGTAIIYIKNDATIEKNVEINKGGDPANVLLIFNKKLEIKEGAEINAFIYVNGSETKIEKNSTINGAIAAKTKLILEKNSTYTYTPSDANNIDASSFCSSASPILDHYEILHDGAGSTCEDETVTIKACANADCSSLYPSSVSVDFNVDGSNKNTTSFTGSTTFSFSHDTNGTKSLSVDNESVPADNAFICTGNDCNIIYSSTGCALSVSTEGVAQRYEVDSYGGTSQDRTGIVEIRDADLSLYLEGNRWQKIDFPYTVTEHTVIEFDFQSTTQGEVQGVGFDTDLSISSNFSFKVYGTQNWGLSNFDTYTGSGTTHFTIPVGEFYTGDFQYLFFMNDDDSNPTGNSLYSNINVYEDTPITPLLEYRFEEENWNGSAGEILDYSGNDHHARANKNSTPQTDSPALTGDPGTCGYASQNSGAIEVTGLPLDTSTVGEKTTVTFWMNWDGTSGVMPIGWHTHDIWIVSGSIGFNTGNSDLYGISSDGLANGWHHVAVEFTNGGVTSNRMYIDGVEQVLTQRRSTPNNSRAYVDSELRIGGWSRGSGYEFTGLIDEVQVYQGALTTAQVNTIMEQRHPCPATPVAEYRFDELIWDGVTNDVLDSSGNALHGLSQGTSPVSGLVCNAADFDRSNHIQVANNTLLEMGDNNADYTVNFWLNPRSTDSAWSNILHKGNINYERTFAAWFNQGNSRIHHRVSTTSSSNEGHDADSALGLNAWSMITLVKQGNQLTTYLNGSVDKQTTLAGDSISNDGPLYIGDDPWYTGIDALMDELTIFGSALDVTAIQAIRTNNLAGNGWDGSTRTCPTEAIPLLEYRFEESSWNSVADEIIDSSGNDHHAQVNNNSSPETTSPALTGDPGTCGYASQNDGSIQVAGLPLDTTTAGVKTTVTFWMNWDGTDNVMPLGWNYHDIWMRNGSIGFNTWSSDIYGISSAGLANGWHHVAVEFTNGSVTSNRMHIDGVEQVLTQRFGSPNNSRAYVNSQMRVGGVSNSAGYDFHGLLDEFRVYESTLTTAQVATIMAERHPCITTPVIDHYEIIHDGQGLTCDAENITIKACTNESCSTESTESASLDFLANGSVISSETFTGSTTISFNHTVAETLTFSLANASIAASNALVCDDGSAASCNMAFTIAGFRFLSGDSNSTILPNQTAGAGFSETLKLQAVKDTSGVCTGIFNGNTSVDLSQENVDPGGTSGLSFTINGTSIAKHTSVSNTTLSFGSDSIAIISNPAYHDAGQIRLHANYNVGGITLTGSSNAFWVSPAELVVSASAGGAALNGATATAVTTHEAGESFDLTVSAYNAASPSVITPNYSPGQIQLKLARTGPTFVDQDSDGDLTYAVASTLETNISPTFENVSLTGFVSGVSSYSSASYSEVGLLNLDVQDSNYGNASIIVPATAIDIGRFIPKYFTQTIVEHGSLLATCNTGTAFAYSGQKDEATDSIGTISYLSNPILAITAYNKQGVITQNYYEDTQGSANDFMKLSPSDIDITAPTLDEVAVGVDSNKLPLTASMSTGTLSQNDLTTLMPEDNPLARGVLHYQFSDDDNFFYNRSANALVAPFTADIGFSMATITDTDAVNATTTVDASPTGVDIRFGRLVLNNSFGPETSNIPQPMQIEHFDGSAFVISEDNHCVSYDTSKISLTNISLDPALTDVLGGTGTFDSGNTQAIELEATGAENQGQIGVSYDVFDWLKYDWSGNDVYDENPSAIATFGLYRGNDRIIYTREIF